jgi:hypothetical protein
MAVTLVVHEFKLGDVDDPILYAAQPLWEWQQTEAGKWVMTHAMEVPCWGRHDDYHTYQYVFRVTAKFHEADATFFKLKYDNFKSK